MDSHNIMVRRKKTTFFGWDTQKVTDYFTTLAKRYGQPFGAQRRWLGATDIPSGAFISHSYQDQSNLQRLLALLPSNFEPTVWPPIRVLPTQFVSTPLIEAVRASPALLYLAEGPSEASPWVAIERDTALRAGKPVFAFYPSTGEFRLDHSPAKSLMIHGIYALGDRPIAEALMNWMEVNRNFRIEDFPPVEYEDMGEYASNIVDFRGKFLAFVRRDTIRDLPLEYVRLACEVDEHEWIIAQQRLMLACLDPPGKWITEDVAQYVIPNIVIDLTDGGKTRPWCANRLDDLIVRIVWLS